MNDIVKYERCREIVASGRWLMSYQGKEEMGLTEQRGMRSDTSNHLP